MQLSDGAWDKEQQSRAGKPAELIAPSQTLVAGTVPGVIAGSVIRVELLPGPRDSTWWSPPSWFRWAAGSPRPGPYPQMTPADRSGRSWPLCYSSWRSVWLHRPLPSSRWSTCVPL